MYSQLKSRIASQLSRPRPIKPQTQRQLSQHLAEYASDVASFLACAADVLEEYELEIVFGPLFTPDLDERGEVVDLLFHWKPSAEELEHLVADLADEVRYATVRMADGTGTPLKLHVVLIDRFVRLLRLNHGPDSATAAAIRDTLPAELWRLAVALSCEPGMSPGHQTWFAAFIDHSAGRRKVSRGFLETVAEFLGRQPDLAREVLLGAAEALVRATQGTAAYAASGHAYWSADVAQHHHYRGQGKVDQQRLEQHRAEVEHVRALAEDLRTFPATAAAM
jgi:hypothetical protein